MLLDEYLDKLVAGYGDLAKSANEFKVINGSNLATTLGLEPLKESDYYLTGSSLEEEVDLLLTTTDKIKLKTLTILPSLLRYVYATLYVVETLGDLPKATVNELAIELCLDSDFCPYQYTQLVESSLTELDIELEARISIYYEELEVLLTRALGNQWYTSTASSVLARLVGSYLIWTTDYGLTYLQFLVTDNNSLSDIIYTDYKYISYKNYKASVNSKANTSLLDTSKSNDLLANLDLDLINIKYNTVLGVLSFNNLASIKDWLKSGLVSDLVLVSNYDFKQNIENSLASYAYITLESDYTVLYLQRTDKDNLRDLALESILTSDIRASFTLVTESNVGSLVDGRYNRLSLKQFNQDIAVNGSVSSPDSFLVEDIGRLREMLYIHYTQLTRALNVCYVETSSLVDTRDTSTGSTLEEVAQLFMNLRPDEVEEILTRT